MSRVNFNMPDAEKKRLNKKIKDMGYMTEAEFWRAKAREVMENG